MKSIVKHLSSAVLGLGLAASALGAAPSGRVLVVLPAVDYLNLRNGNIHHTGYFLSEFATPVYALMSQGYEVVVATPGGRAPTMDPISDDPKWFSNPAEYAWAKQLVASRLSGPQRPLESLTIAQLDSVDALFLPGGHAAMQDLPRNSSLGAILRYFHATAKPTALICHAPTALASTRDYWGRSPYDGYRTTVFSTAEEQQEEQPGPLGGWVLEYPEQILSAMGIQVSVGAPWTSHVVRDRELITGQNPMSDKELAATLLQALRERKTALPTFR